MRAHEVRNPLTLDSRPPAAALGQYLSTESRFDKLTHADDPNERALLRAAEDDVAMRWRLYEQLASLTVAGKPPA